MFGDALLDSSPSRAPVLEGVHYTVSAIVGALGFLAGLCASPRFFVPAETKALVFEAAVFGALLTCHALMFCYVLVDARHLRLSVPLWLAVTLTLHLAGFLFYLVYSAARTGNWKRATLPIAYVSEVLLVGVIAVVPLVHTEALPKMLVVGPIPLPTAPPPPPAIPPAHTKAPRRVSAEEILKAPVTIPETIAVIREEPVPPEGVAGVVPAAIPGGIPHGTPGGFPTGLLDGNAWSWNPPPPPKVSKPAPIRVGGQVIAAKLIYQPMPDFPAMARMARIQGTVLLEAGIAKDGSIQSLKVLRGHPLLVTAALEAVKRWRYQPTLLNGEPVEVLTEISVNFTLDQ
jgi:protein TonB